MCLSYFCHALTLQKEFFLPSLLDDQVLFLIPCPLYSAKKKTVNYAQGEESAREMVLRVELPFATWR